MTRKSKVNWLVVGLFLSFVTYGVVIRQQPDEAFWHLIPAIVVWVFIFRLVDMAKED